MNIVIIAGGRNFNNKKFFLKSLSSIEFKIDEIVSGKCKGVDKLGECYAIENNINIKYFIAKWELYGKSAGPIRNKEMVKYATHLIAFWDGNSRGTKNVIELAKKNNLTVIIFYY